MTTFIHLKTKSSDCPSPKEFIVLSHTVTLSRKANTGIHNPGKPMHLFFLVFDGDPGQPNGPSKTEEQDADRRERTALATGGPTGKAADHFFTIILWSYNYGASNQTKLK